jgi:ubiquitin carboxyl-terminal hydrolase 5/13
MERAVTWIFSHEESSGGNGVEATAVEKVDEGSAEYELFAFVSHKGTSTGCGHYVAHVRGKEGWVLMNDEKVVGVPESMVEESIGAGYV